MGIRMILCGLLGFLMGRKRARRVWLAFGLTVVSLLPSFPSCFLLFQPSSGLEVVYMPLPLSYPLHLELRRMPIQIYPPMYVVRLFLVLELYSFEVQSESLYALTLNFLPLFYLLNLAAAVAGSQLSKSGPWRSAERGGRFK